MNRPGLSYTANKLAEIAPAQTRSNIMQEFDALRKRIAEAHDYLCQLQNRLGPVLRESGPETAPDLAPDNKIPTPKSLGTSPVAVAFKDCGSALDELIGRMTDIMGRLDT